MGVLAVVCGLQHEPVTAPPPRLADARVDEGARDPLSAVAGVDAQVRDPRLRSRPVQAWADPQRDHAGEHAFNLRHQDRGVVEGEVVEEHLPLRIGVVGNRGPPEFGDEREDGVRIPGLGSS